MLEMYKKFCADYPVVTIEDPFEQDDWDNCAAFTTEDCCQVVGDDILVTNPTRVKKAIDGKTVNALLLKVRRACWRHVQRSKANLIRAARVRDRRAASMPLLAG
jgi:hypothetical protein